MDREEGKVQWEKVDFFGKRGMFKSFRLSVRGRLNVRRRFRLGCLVNSWVSATVIIVLF